MRKSVRWLEALSAGETVDFCREMGLAHALKGGPVGETIVRLIRADDIRALCEFEMSYRVEDFIFHREWLDLAPGAYVYHPRAWEGVVRSTAGLRFLYVKRVRECRQALAYFQKLSFLDIGIDKQEVALQKFLEAEAACKLTNDAFTAERAGRFNHLPDVSAVIHTASRKISRILGHLPRLADLKLVFGPGATLGTKRKMANPRRKIAELLSCSEELSPLVPYLMEELPHLTSAHASVTRVDEDGEEWDQVEVAIRAARLAFVPKSAKTYRTVVVDPPLNVIVGLAYGRWIQRRLAAFGIDITDQTVNQRRAREGSLTGALATLDLVSASDMLSKELVYSLLPLDWATALNRARSVRVELPGGSVIRQEKFSSMGNGFTFPLQTLVFWSIAASCCERESDVTVYGDDIVVPSGKADAVTRALHLLGFKVNVLKSYSKGPFRESCGKDYVWGTDVRPFYQRDLVTPQSLFVLHNFYKRSGDDANAERVESFIDKRLRLYGPDGFGDGHLIGENLGVLPPELRDRGYSGSFFRTYSSSTGVDHESESPEVEYALALYSAYTSGSEKDFLDGCIPKTVAQQVFHARWSRGIGSRALRSLPLQGKNVKSLPLPEVIGYKKVKVYIFG